MQNYPMQRKDTTQNPFGIRGNLQNTRRHFKVLSVIFHLIPAFGLCFEHNVLNISKLKAVFVIFQKISIN